MIHILKYYKFYWRHRVEYTTRFYFEVMVANANGRLDREGICPYHCDENDDLMFPTEGMIEAWWTSKAKPGKGESKTLSWASRELEDREDDGVHGGSWFSPTRSQLPDPGTRGQDTT